MRFHIITLFPKAFDSYLNESIISRAIKDKKISVKFYNPRDFAKNKFRHIDQKPYGGGPGMVIEALPVLKAIEMALRRIKNNELRIKNKRSQKKQYSIFNIQNSVKIIWLSPSGKKFGTLYAKNSAKKFRDIIIVCGRYEGIDARVKKVFKMDEISIGDYILTGGELPAMVIMDSVSRQIEGVLGNFNSLEESRTASKDVYTRPETIEYKGKKYKVPKVLLSGNHKKIEEWKKKKS
jgi:tRNA (guanine37-N1)-methyltransferase